MKNNNAERINYKLSKKNNRINNKLNNKINNKLNAKLGQITLEFITVISFGMLMTVFFSYFVYSELQDKESQESEKIIYEISRVISEEIYLASVSHEGYSRAFILPEKILDEDYEINEYNGTLVGIKLDKTEFMFSTVMFQGNITKDNFIRNIAGSVVVGPR